MTPSFDEIVGSSELTDAERDRLQRVHELLVVAGPPPELSPQLEQAPDPDNVHVLRRPNPTRRALLLVAAVLVAVGIFGGGYQLGHSGGRAAAVNTLRLRGTAVAPQAQGFLRILKPSAGNWPMTLSVVNLPKLPRHAFYEVYLVRNGKPWGSCGSFVVNTTSRAITVTLTAPYALRPGDSWIVTREHPGETGPGQTVLRPSARV